jgi:hypothetical protein
VGRGPASRAELLPLVACLAEIGDEQAASFFERLRTHEPLEAAALEAVLRARQGRLGEAMHATGAALDGYQRNPWPEPSLMQRVVVLAGELAAGEPSRARRLVELLARPFALHGSEQERLASLAQALTALEPGPACVEVFRNLEPNVPWVEGWLALRHRCYAAAAGPEEQLRAAAELDGFRREQPSPFYFGLASETSR